MLVRATTRVIDYGYPHLAHIEGKARRLQQL
jgi:hypothetical protein